MSEFALYFKLGFQHISDLRGYDHIIFLTALCAPYILNHWKQILVLVTAFTIGHSITLALSTLKIFLISGDIIEFLIPVTIFATCVINFFGAIERKDFRKMRLHYGMALFFGFIHGMGFSNYLRALLGNEESIITPLFAFNIGLEAGQVMIVAIILGITLIIVRYFSLSHRMWNALLSGIVACISVFLMFQTKFW